MQFRANKGGICEWFANNESQSDCKDHQWFQNGCNLLYKFYYFIFQTNLIGNDQ